MPEDILSKGVVPNISAAGVPAKTRKVGGGWNPIRDIDILKKFRVVRAI